ncbi:MAG: response regulator [Pseudomonadales bacterium]
MSRFIPATINTQLMALNVAVVGLLFTLTLLSLNNIDRLERSSVTDVLALERSEGILTDMLRLTALIRDEAQFNLDPFKRPLIENTEQYTAALIEQVDKLSVAGAVSRLKLERLVDDIHSFAGKNRQLIKTIDQEIESSRARFEPGMAALDKQLASVEQALFSAQSYTLARSASAVRHSARVLYDQISLYKAVHVGHNKVLEQLTAFAAQAAAFETALGAQQVVASHRVSNQLESYLSVITLQLKTVGQRVKLEREINRLILPAQFTAINEILSDVRSVASSAALAHRQNLVQARRSLLLSGIALMCAALCVGWLLRRKFIRRLNVSVDTALDLARGDIVKYRKEERLASLRSERDELAMLGEAFFDIASHQRRMLTDIKASCEDLANGHLNHSTDYSYQGDYRDIEQALNSSRRALQVVVTDIVRHCEYLAKGKLNISPKQVYVGDFKPIQTSLSAVVINLRHQLNDIVSVTRGMSANLDSEERFIVPTATYHGDFQQIRDTLAAAVDNLKRSAAENTGQNWLKSGLSEMNQQLTGEQPLAVLCKNSIDFIAHYLDAPIGYMYRTFEEDQFQGKALRMIAHYGVLMDNETRKTRYQFVYPEGVGLIGQVFVKPALVVKKLQTDERVSIEQSGIAYANPAYVAVLPLVHEGRVEGVLELGLYRGLSDIQQEFLQQVMPSLGIAMNVAISRDRMNLLLAQSQRQAEALEHQQSQLANSNEMLQLKARELEDKQWALEQKNDQLEQAGGVLEERAAELALASKYKSEFLANMSHELRSPLNSLLILAKLLTDNPHNHLDDTEVSYASIIHRSGTDLLHLIEDILDLSKIEAGKTDIQYERVALDNVLEKLAARYKTQAEQQAIDFSWHNNLHLDALAVDEKRLVQILANLLSNAFKFTPGGEVRLSVDHAARGYALKGDKALAFDAICYRVSDTGIGIAEADQARIFQAFQQVDGTTNRRYEGTGLGLSISEQLVSLMGGVIDLHSVEGQGSVFSVYLPLRESDRVTSVATPIESAQQTAEPVTAETVSGKQLLAVGCDEAVSELLREQLGSDYQLLSCTDVGAAMQVLAKSAVCAVILTPDLPCAPIASMVRRIKSRIESRHIPVCCMCAREDQLHALQAGAYRVLGLLPEEREIKQLLQDIERPLQAVRQLHVIPELKPWLRDCLANAPLELTVCDWGAAFEGGDAAVIVIDESTQYSVLEAQLVHLSVQALPAIVYADQELSEAWLQRIAQLQQDYVFTLTTSQPALVLQSNLYLHQMFEVLSGEQQQLLQRHFCRSDVLRGKKVMIVDDNMSNVFALSAVLERLDVSVLIATNGLEALALAQGQNDIDMMLMDIMMPELDGYETIKAIRAESDYLNTPIIALTAKAMPEDRLKCIQAGANDYLTKPLDEPSLIEVMQNWLVVNPDSYHLDVEQLH